jgi:capsular polysaccharide export protein
MKKFTTSHKLIENTKNFLTLQYYSIVKNLLGKKGNFYGWGRKKSGFKAIELAKKHNTCFVLLEDGFIRSLGLGVEGSPSFSLVEDDVGIYYDATTPSKLENLLNSYDFQADKRLMEDAKEAMELIKKHHISKYNNAPDISAGFFSDDSKERVLVIAQTAGDSSLEYGMLQEFTTDEMVQTALDENPEATVYIKIHPDVLSGKKKSDIDIQKFQNSCQIIDENFNPISLLKQFQKVYTKTSGMGFEALLVGCECVCFGMPFYAGWGVTKDKVHCPRRERTLRVEEIFAAAYILYSRYYNPYEKKESNIFDTIKSLRDAREQHLHKGKLD